ncbi:hypothetical protein HK099_000051 [Clydaea vesicula]|uniref:GATA-type domain-containing protein n=1 Tax=Clydaea vesicula TaxID=447962 RepID=A0AAD5Y3Z9_9FUNG|nr:hypothetical protein HK099_000051 [Clydaea vesicula]
MKSQASQDVIPVKIVNMLPSYQDSCNSPFQQEYITSPDVEQDSFNLHRRFLKAPQFQENLQTDTIVIHNSHSDIINEVGANPFNQLSSNFRQQNSGLYLPTLEKSSIINYPVRQHSTQLLSQEHHHNTHHVNDNTHANHNHKTAEALLDKILYACDTMKKVVLANKSILLDTPNSILPTEPLRKIYAKTYDTYQLLSSLSFTHHPVDTSLQNFQSHSQNKISVNLDNKFKDNSQNVSEDMDNEKIYCNKGSVTTGDLRQTNSVKKRRRGAQARVGALGVCHSCHTKDTPEWRRGPDGARTLCNACGLHFAKLMRRRNKQQQTDSMVKGKDENSTKTFKDVLKEFYSNQSVVNMKNSKKSLTCTEVNENSENLLKEEDVNVDILSKK